MLYLIPAILGGAMIAIVMRISEDHTSSKTPKLAISYFTSTLLAAIHMLTAGQSLIARGSSAPIIIGSIGGVLYLSSFLLLELNVRKNGIVLSSTFMKLGLLVPLVMSLVFFNERPSLIQFGGVLLAVIAIVLINLKDQDNIIHWKIGLPLLLIINGSADAISKVYEQFGPASMSDQFLFYIFVVAALLSGILTFVRHEKVGKADILFGALLGLPNFYAARITLKALEYIPASIFYPSCHVGTLMVVTLTGLFFFKEKLSKLQWAAVMLIFIAMILLNM